MQRLQSQHKAQVRNADSPTNEMYGECQELLQMFGLPYVIAPMEAEAQCAWLDEANLVDGVVTDDNDVFLFGGQHVYRWGLLLCPLFHCVESSTVGSSCMDWLCTTIFAVLHTQGMVWCQQSLVVLLFFAACATNMHSMTQCRACLLCTSKDALGS